MLRNGGTGRLLSPRWLSGSFPECGSQAASRADLMQSGVNSKATSGSG